MRYSKHLSQVKPGTMKSILATIHIYVVAADLV
jgi:hypothetical protein